MGTTSDGGSRYQIGSINGGAGHHFGDHGTIHNNALPAADLRGRLEEVLKAARAGGAVDPAIGEEAVAVDAELAGGTVDHSRIRSLLARVTEAAGAASVVGAAATQLAAAIQSF